jgi:excinuclease UvrABC nuclease subunit
VTEGIDAYRKAREIVQGVTGKSGKEYDVLAVLAELERDMEQAARNLQFERAIEYRNQIDKLKKTAGREEGGK